MRLSFEAARLTVQERGEPAGDAPKVQEAMLGPKVLDAARFPAITFESTTVAGTPSAPGAVPADGRWRVDAARRDARGHAAPRRRGGRRRASKATGRMTVRQTDYGIDPVSVAGVVKVKNELAIEYTIVARPAEP